MPESPALTTPPLFGVDPLRIVLFGLPEAGKSSLLGALSQAAQLQEHVLNGRLTDVANGLTQLRERLYGAGPKETLNEIVPFQVIYQPFKLVGKNDYADPESAVLIDCDGRIATDLIMGRRSLELEPGDGGLAPSILAADALLLVIDASAPATQVDADFTEFGRFLRLLETTRGNRADTGGLPAFLVLTKCDLLARTGDSVDTWFERIEESKREVDQQFKDFLVATQDANQDGFGSVGLRVWATAIKRPPLPAASGGSQEPYGVAELFRQAFEDAREFRERQQRSSRRIAFTGAGIVAFIFGMLAMVGIVFSNRHVEEPVVRELAAKIESYHGREPSTASARLRGDVQSRISDLKDLQGDPIFSRLPSDQQKYVNDRLDELNAYRDFQDQLARIPTAASARNGGELQAIETSLKKLEPPENHRNDWGQTEAMLARGRRLQEIAVYRSAVTEVADWFDGLARKGQGLLTFENVRQGGPVAWPDWIAQVQGLDEEAGSSRFRPGQNVPHSTISYDAVLRSDPVATARGNWELVRTKLARVRDLVSALGLSGQTGKAPLNLTSSFTADQAAARVADLERLYPGFRETFSVAGLPEVVAEQIRQAARVREQYCSAAGQAVVLRHLNDAMSGQKETYESWKKLLPWLAAPDELASWRIIATVLARLQNPAALDPITALTAFIRQPKFELSLRQITLEIPDDAHVRPDGSFTIYSRKAAGDPVPYVFEKAGDEKRELARAVTVYTFRSNQQTISYEPGNSLWADVPVKNQESSNYRLTWSRSRSQVYQFQCLQSSPRLHLASQSHLDGKLEEGITLSFVPENGIPSLPTLVPNVPVVE
jgi:hypothetical protein